MSPALLVLSGLNRLMASSRLCMTRHEYIPRPLLIKYRYYQAGVGSMGTLSNKVVQGISGEGLAEHVRTSRSAVFLLEIETNSPRRGIHVHCKQLESWR